MTKHDCIDKMNEMLKNHNTRLSHAIDFSSKPRELVLLATSKANEKVRRKPAMVFASYCPFCGNKLEGVGNE